jgi:hypothetical protein
MARHGGSVTRWIEGGPGDPIENPADPDEKCLVVRRPRQMRRERPYFLIILGRKTAKRRLAASRPLFISQSRRLKGCVAE